MFRRLFHSSFQTGSAHLQDKMFDDQRVKKQQLIPNSTYQRHFKWLKLHPQTIHYFLKYSNSNNTCTILIINTKINAMYYVLCSMDLLLFFLPYWSSHCDEISCKCGDSLLNQSIWVHPIQIQHNQINVLIWRRKNANKYIHYFCSDRICYSGLN